MSSMYSSALVVLAGVLVGSNALKLNEAMMLGTHNSMHLKSTPRLVDWDYEHPTFYEQVSMHNVRQFELDMQDYLPERDDFEVLHIPIYDANGTCYSVRECEADLVRYAQENPNHAPLFIYIDVKVVQDVPGWQAFDRITREIWGDRVFTPEELRGSYASPNARVRAEGWPELDDLRGRVITFIDAGKGYEPVPNPESFVLYNFGVPATEPNAVVVSIGDIRGADNNQIREKFDAGFIFRCRSDNPESFRLPQPTCDEVLDGLFDTMDIEEPFGRVSVEEMTQFINVAGGDFPGLAIDALFISCGILSRSFTRSQAPCIRDRARLFTGNYPAIAEDWKDLADVIDRRDSTLNSGCHLISTDHEVPSDVYEVRFDTEFVVNPGPSNVQRADSSKYNADPRGTHAVDREATLRNAFETLSVQFDQFMLTNGNNRVIDADSGVDVGERFKTVLMDIEYELAAIERRST